MNLKLASATFGIYLFLAGVIYLFTNVMRDVPIRAAVYPRNVQLSQPIFFSDSTRQSGEVLWEFGNGDSRTDRKGAYHYKKDGKYIVRLTVDKKTDTFYVHVTSPPIVHTKPKVVLILADETGIVNEKIHFKALGDGIEWCEWYFGESGKIDAREKDFFYSYKKKGKFEISLRTNLNPQVPKKHFIEILPQYNVTQVLPALTKTPKGGGSAPVSDFQTRLQSMARGANFLVNYNYLVKKYLCNNPYTVVSINGKTSNDFYSYCQGIQLKSGIIIDKTSIQLNPKTKCPDKIIIQQH